MGVEILGADVTPKQVEASEGNANFHTEMNGKQSSNFAEINEPTKTGSVDLNGTIGKAKEADNPVSSNTPKDAVDEWPAPKQIHTFYFIRVRSYEDPKLKTKLGDADKDLQRMNRSRAEIIEALKEKRSERSNLKSKLQPFLAENKKHRTTMEAKMQEMRPLREDLHKHRTESNTARENGMGLCSSEEELDDLIQSLHYRIQHESNTLNEEKQLLKEIKQLEASRQKVIANTKKKVELEEKKGQKAEIQDKMKLLGVNMDEVRKEKQTVIANIKQIDEELKVVDDEIAALEEKLRSVTERRDKAYETLNAFRKSRDEVNACFYQNRSLLNIAKDLAAKKDIVGLEALSNTEVDKFMSQWGSNKAFRDDYERRILTSLDSRQLSRDGRIRNPDEKPIVVETLPPPKLEVSPLNVIPTQGKEVTKLPASEDIAVSNVTRGEELTKSAKADASRKISKEEARKAHEDDEQPQESSKSKEIDPAQLKEMKREEEIAKAKLAMERKKKLAEKAAAKAAARAQKEAEKKQKQKEKKAKKKAGTTDAAVSGEEAEADMEGAEPEETDVKLDNPVAEVSKEPKVNLKNRNRQKVQEQLPKVILKRKKAYPYKKWIVPASILALVLVVVAGYYSFGRI